MHIVLINSQESRGVQWNVSLHLTPTSQPHLHFSVTPKVASSFSNADMWLLCIARETLWLRVYSSHWQEFEASLRSHREDVKDPLFGSFWIFTLNANWPSAWLYYEVLTTTTHTTWKWRKSPQKRTYSKYT